MNPDLVQDIDDENDFFRQYELQRKLRMGNNQNFYGNNNTNINNGS